MRNFTTVSRTRRMHWPFVPVWRFPTSAVIFTFRTLLRSSSPWCWAPFFWRPTLIFNDTVIPRITSEIEGLFG